MLIVDTNYIHEKRTIHHVMNILSMTNIQKEFVQIIYTHISCRSYALNQPHTCIIQVGIHFLLLFFLPLIY